jgi:hypothetical protein
MFLGGFAALFLLAGCGGGGDAPQGQPPVPSGPVSVLEWTPPTTYNDNAVMDPQRDLDFYEIYVRKDPNFTDSDLPLVQVAAATAGSLVTEFTLELIPSLPAGGQLFVSMRAVGVDQQKSAFMTPVPWSRS